MFVHTVRLSNPILAAFLPKPQMSFLRYVHNRTTYCVFARRLLNCTSSIWSLLPQLHWKLGGLVQVCFLPAAPPPTLLYCAGITACSITVWLSPLYCMRQQWDWPVCFISAHMEASQVLENYSLKSWLKGRGMFCLVIAPDLFLWYSKGRCRADCFPCLTGFHLHLTRML